ncbi:MAG: NAD(P)-dependent dehydrogenase (short-subunit alcohol dehydrogenase family) [Nitriliruptoraceae bacterium]|jgi:NAD(P)-dependent dehydrogenase (short-subunit alcohol dehydrogenase family)
MAIHLLVGAAGGIGSALARQLTARGDTVLLAGRTDQPLAALAAELGQPWTALDARDFEAVDGAVGDLVDEHGQIDGATNCAGSVVLKPAHLTTAADYADVIATNLTTAFAVVRAAAPKMRRTGGSIALVSTAAAATGIANHEAVAAAKGGIEALVRSAAATYGARGVRVNAVAPGLVETPQTAAMLANQTQADASRAMHVLGRFGTPDDIASALAWLLDPATSWVTGQVLGVDGGLGQVRTRAKA